MSRQFDLIVVGGGPGGYVTAIRAAQLGFRTAVVERERLGGVCLNWGCIPTKALLRGAEIAHQLDDATRFGFSFDNLRFDINRLVEHSRSVAGRLSDGIGYLMRKHEIVVIEGDATLTSKCELGVTRNGKQEHYRANHIVLATGARPKTLPGLEIDGELVWGAREAMVPKALPKRLLVVGAGAIGTEFASLYADLGSQVTLVEALDRILPMEDSDISVFARKQFERRGLDVRTSTSVADLDRAADSVTATLSDGESLTVDRVIVAIGITGNIENLGLESVGAKTDRGFIQTDGFGRTGVVGLYAVGDVAGPPWLAHKASHEGVACIEKIAGVDAVHALDAARIPACTFCRPQIASIGLTEAAAKTAGHSVRTGRFDLTANGKALAVGDSAGFVKTVFDAATGELLGAHMIGPEVTEQIQGFAIAMGLECTEAELAQTVFPHPTLSEAMHESVLDAYGRALHH